GRRAARLHDLDLSGAAEHHLGSTLEALDAARRAHAPPLVEPLRLARRGLEERQQDDDAKRARIVAGELQDPGVPDRAGRRALAPAPAPAGRPLASLAHGERPAPELRAVEGADRRLGLGIGGELDEGEAARPPGLPVGDDLHLFDLAPLLLEQGAQLRLVALVGQVAYVQSLSHSSSRTNEDAEDDPRRSR